MVGNFLHAIRWNIRHHNALPGGFRDINIIQTDAKPSDSNAMGSSLDDPGRDRFPAGEDSLGLRRKVGQIIFRTGAGDQHASVNTCQDSLLNPQVFPDVVAD